MFTFILLLPSWILHAVLHVDLVHFYPIDRLLYQMPRLVLLSYPPMY